MTGGPDLRGGTKKVYRHISRAHHSLINNHGWTRESSLTKRGMVRPVSAYGLFSLTRGSFPIFDDQHTAGIQCMWYLHMTASIMDGNISFTITARVSIKTDSWEGEKLEEQVLHLTGIIMV